VLDAALISDVVICVAHGRGPFLVRGDASCLPIRLLLTALCRNKGLWIYFYVVVIVFQACLNYCNRPTSLEPAIRPGSMDSQDRAASFHPMATRSGRSYGIGQLVDEQEFHRPESTSPSTVAVPLAPGMDEQNEYQPPIELDATGVLDRSPPPHGSFIYAVTIQ